MTAPSGAIVSISYDPDPGVTVRVGDVLKTKAGRLYLVIGVKTTEHGKHMGRHSITASVLVPKGGTVHDLHWYPRNKATAR